MTVTWLLLIGPTPMTCQETNERQPRFVARLLGVILFVSRETTQGLICRPRRTSISRHYHEAEVFYECHFEKIIFHEKYVTYFCGAFGILADVCVHLFWSIDLVVFVFSLNPPPPSALSGLFHFSFRSVALFTGNYSCDSVLRTQKFMSPLLDLELLKILSIQPWTWYFMLCPLRVLRF